MMMARSCWQARQQGLRSCSSACYSPRAITHYCQGWHQQLSTLGGGSSGDGGSGGGGGDELGDLLGLRSELGKKGVRWLLPSYVDMHGVSKSKVVPLSHFANMMAGSEMFTGAALDGVPQDMSDPEVCSMPDMHSCVVLPWRPDTAWFASNLNVLGAGEFDACSRRILLRVLERARQMGFCADFGTEAEFFVFDDSGDVEPTGKPGNTMHYSLCWSPPLRLCGARRAAADELPPPRTTQAGLRRAC
jgi:hypothetical protein